MFEYSKDGFVGRPAREDRHAHARARAQATTHTPPHAVLPTTAGANENQRIYSMDKGEPIYASGAINNASFNSLTTQVDTKTSLSAPILPSSHIRSITPSATTDTQLAACSLSGTDQFENLTTLAGSYDPTSRVRCGWIYNTADPTRGRGSLGIQRGPYVPSTGPVAEGIWMWDLQAAKKKYHRWLCQQVNNCGQLLNRPYNGRCGWCQSSGKAIPITSTGAVAYPSDPNLTCSTSSLVIPTNPSSCPAPTAAAQAAQGWSQLPNGNLPRRALISQAELAGCSDSGTLIQALQAGSDMNYFSNLAQQLSYTTYQQRAMPSMNEAQLKTGNVVIGQALAEFQQVKSQASSTVNDPALRSAARDLCYTAGTMASYDFCTELLDSTPAPYTLECLQKQFMRAGGQRTGSMYPSTANMATWNSYTTWSKVNTAIQAMKTATTSIDRSTQAQAIQEFYGIQIPASMPMTTIPGVEIFWFTNTDNDVANPRSVFLGRRIRPKIPFINQTNDLQGVSKHTNVSMVFFTNLSFPNYNGVITCRATSDDAFGITLSRPLGAGFKNTLRVTDATSLIALDNVRSTTFSTNSWQLTAKGPNKLSGLWFQGSGGHYFKFEYNDGKTWGEVPQGNLTLTQESFAPMMSFEVYRNPEDYGADFNFADTRMGALKMKWAAQTGTPAWYYSANGPLGLPYVNFKENSSMNMLCGFKIYSFSMMTVLITFNALPSTNGVSMQEYISMPGTLGKVAIQVVGNGTYGQGKLQLYANTGGKGVTTVSAGTVKQGVPYLLAFTVNRTDPTQVSSVNGVSLGIQELSILQGNPTRMAYPASIRFPNPKLFSDPNSKEARTMIVGNGDINVTWVRLYDYILNSTQIAKEVSDSWQ